MIRKYETMKSEKDIKQNEAKNEQRKIKYNAEYISYIENGNSGAVLITRDIADEIDTKGKWIDVVEVEFEKRNNRNDYKYFIVELFDRKKRPRYTKDMSAGDKKYLTWQVATEDIAKQRERGITGQKYIVIPYLINKNKGKWITVTRAWNKTFNCFVPNKWFTSSCEWRKKKEYIPPRKDNWQYKVKAIKRISDKQVRFIQKNRCDILIKIENAKEVKLDFFNLR